jgi:fructose-1,6-bisphosphatase/inositol monophosphatase family enzyme
VIDKVEALVRDVAASAVMPRFRALTQEEIESKGPGDLVTIADREAEALLAAGLTTLLPGSRVVGEEAAFEDPMLLDAVGMPGNVWLVDPVDGTANFAAGRDPFAIMVALLRDGVIMSSWIYQPVRDVFAMAERGSGAFLDGVRVKAPTTARPTQELRGPSFSRHFPETIRRGVEQARPSVGQILPGHNCAGYEYPAVVLDEQQFVVFWRTLPWDHAPGVLFVEEAGGVAWRLDGTPYLPADTRPGLLIAQNQHTWDAVRSTLLADVPDTPLPA